MKSSLSPRVLAGMLRDAAVDWWEDSAPRLGAALAYYTVFSLAPLLIIAIAIGGMVFGEEAARGQIVAQLQGLLGRDGGLALEAAIDNASGTGSSVVATVIGVVVLLFGASGVFVELQAALNVVWEVKAPQNVGIRKNILLLVRERFLSFAMVLGVGFLLLVSLVLSAGLEAVVAYASGAWAQLAAFGRILNVVLSLALSTGLFAMIYKVLPDAKVGWRDVWFGAAIASALFTLGKFGIGLYLGHTTAASIYGAAGSLVIVLVWTYYSAQILLFGAEVCQVSARRRGTPIEPRVAEVGESSRGSFGLDSPRARAH